MEKDYIQNVESMIYKIYGRVGVAGRTDANKADSSEIAGKGEGRDAIKMFY